MAADDSWVFDSLVEFLRGPVWNVPILTFIEHKSLIFEPGESENESEYKKIHEDYKNLVDFMLGSYMEDIHITPEQFEAACGKASGQIKSQFHHNLFEQVWAADDYEIFKRMMIQKNIELQLQALAMIQQRYGLVPASMVPDGDGEDAITKQEAAVMEEVIKKSLAEWEAYEAQVDAETKEIERSLAETMDEKLRLESEQSKEKQKMDEAVRQSLKDAAGSVDIPKSSSTPAPVPVPQTSIGPEEMRRRQEYLRAQRDKLLAMKKQEREKQLAKAEQSTKSRPKSSRAARTAMSGKPTIDAKTLQIRQALAERLKAEVIEEYKSGTQ